MSLSRKAVNGAGMGWRLIVVELTSTAILSRVTDRFVPGADVHVRSIRHAHALSIFRCRRATDLFAEVFGSDCV